MFLKLLKYDMKAVFRMWWLVLPVLPVFILLDAVIARIFTQILADAFTNTDFFLTDGMLALMILVMLVCYFAFIGVTVLLAATVFYTEFLVLYRFFKNLFTDEGYLTFTLPAKRSTILLSKTVNSIFWILLHYLILAVGAVFIFLFAIPTINKDFLFGFTLFGELATQFFKAVAESWGWLIVIIIEAIILSVLTAISTISIFHFCFTLGAIIVKKCKLLAGIGVYCLVQWVLPFITTTVYYILYFFFGSVMATVAAMSSSFSMGAMVAIAMAMFGVLILLQSHFFYFLTRNCLERRLNLA